MLYTRVSKNASNDDGPSSFGGSLLSTLEKRYGWWWCFSLSLSHWCSKGRATTRSSVVVDQKKKIQKRTTTTRRRRHKARFFCVEMMICVVVVVSKKKKKKKECVCFVAPFNTKCRRENREEALTKREREEEATQKKGIKFFCLEKKKRFLKTYDLGFRVLLKPRKNCMSFSFALT